MNKIVVALSAVAVGAGLPLCDVCRVAGSVVEPEPTSGVHTTTEWRRAVAEIRVVTLKIKGMTCGGCVFGVRKVLTRLPGVSRVDVTYEQSRAVVTYDPAAATVEQMVAAIRTLGYTAAVIGQTAT